MSTDTHEDSQSARDARMAAHLARQAGSPRLEPDCVRPRVDRVVTEFRNPVTTEPTLVQKASSLVKAVVKHVVAGCPTRTEERQAELKAICLQCPHQRGGAASCAVCGCAKMDWKRSMKTERCPLSLWPEDD